MNDIAYQYMIASNHVNIIEKDSVRIVVKSPMDIYSLVA